MHEAARQERARRGRTRGSATRLARRVRGRLRSSTTVDSGSDELALAGVGTSASPVGRSTQRRASPAPLDQQLRRLQAAAPISSGVVALTSARFAQPQRALTRDRALVLLDETRARARSRAGRRRSRRPRSRAGRGRRAAASRTSSMAGATSDALVSRPSRCQRQSRARGRASPRRAAASAGCSAAAPHSR